MIVVCEPMEVDLARRSAARRRANRNQAGAAWAATVLATLAIAWVLAMLAFGWVSSQSDQPAQHMPDEVGATLAIGRTSIQPARAGQRMPEGLRAVLAPTSTI